jgi:glyoxylase-like metal-dependent hydrolase (beta-lactamase superfamily II)
LSIYTIDCNYIEKEIAAAFLMVEGKEVAFIENNTFYAVPLLLEELNKHSLKPSDVKYLIVTHIHLDHAGGTSELLKHCPNAIVLAHRQAAPHLINPKRLIESAIQVYGSETFKKLYGIIEPIPEEKIRIMQDGEEIKFGSRKLKFIYTRGHANHHFVIYDSFTNGIFTGDSFGIGYKRLQNGNSPFLFLSTTPNDFDPDEALISIDKILSTGADKAYLTHYGEWSQMQLGAEQLRAGIKEMASLLDSAITNDVSDDGLQKFCEEKVREFFLEELKNRGIEKEIDGYIHLDIEINAQGIAYAAKRARKKMN